MLYTLFITDMSTLNETTYAGSIKSAEEMLALWRQVEVDIAETGQSYRSPGGVEVSLAELGMVQKQIRYWYGRVLAKRGYNGRNTADIEPGKDENAGTL